mmetsp:Transcript_78774/g.231122  ORF Transcript_78774/g.231122 Transcript_78774/m.231122 type:complete len:532 (+) Transcript_78774:90-1685(+)
MQKRRRIELDFPSVGADSGEEEPSSWRNGKLSDWTLHLSQTDYQVHRFVFGQGPRSSVFLSKAFSGLAFGSSATATTDLTGLIPSCCEGRIFEAALDFAYTGKLATASAMDLVLLCKVGDVLQMRALLEVAVGWLNLEGAISGPSAIGMMEALAQVGSIGSGLQAGVEEVAAEAIASQINECKVSELALLPTEFMAALLERDNLQVRHEDDVFELVHQLAPVTPDAQLVAGLWQKVRFGQLSPKALIAAAKVKEIPQGLFAYLLAGGALGPSAPRWFEGAQIQPPDSDFPELGSWLGERHFLPRRCMGSEHTVNVLHVYSVKQDAVAAYLAEYGRGHELLAVMKDRCSKWESMNMQEPPRSLEGHCPDVVITAGIKDPPAQVPEVVRNGLPEIFEHKVGVVALTAISCLGIEPVEPVSPLIDEDFLEICIDEPGTLSLCVPDHPIFRNFDPRAYAIGGLIDTLPRFDVKKGSRVLAKWSQTETPEIIESADSRVVTFVHLEHAATWNRQMRHLLRNAVAYVAPERRRKYNV